MLLSSLHASSAWRQSNSSSPVSSLARGTYGSAVTDDLRNVTQRPPAPPETFRVAHRNSFLDFRTLPAFCLIEKCLKSALTVRIKKKQITATSQVLGPTILDWWLRLPRVGSTALHRKANFTSRVLILETLVQLIQLIILIEARQTNKSSSLYRYVSTIIEAFGIHLAQRSPTFRPSHISRQATLPPVLPELEASIKQLFWKDICCQTCEAPNLMQVCWILEIHLDDWWVYLPISPPLISKSW